MNIIHICLNAPYTEDWGYQENILTKYNVKQGHTVTIIAPNQMHIETGEIVEISCENYINLDGVHVIRVKKEKSLIPHYEDVFTPYKIFPLLCELTPDIIMVHGFIGSVSALQICKYIERIRPECRVIVDIHQDIYNSMNNKNLKGRLLTVIHRYLNKKMFPLYQKIFCVAPSSAEYAIEYYHAPSEKLELLPLGYDPELIDFSQRDSIRAKIRAQHGLKDSDIVLCHGAKFSDEKKTAELVQAFELLSKKFENLKLLLFGSFVVDYENKVFSNGIPDGVIYMGMLENKDYYNVYLSSDLAVFPGGQSVLWQQAIGCGIGTVIPNLPHTQYLNLGGNTVFFDGDTVDVIYKKLYEIIEQRSYIHMGQVAREKGIDYFSFKRIAQQMIDGAMSKDNS